MRFAFYLFRAFFLLGLQYGGLLFAHLPPFGQSLLALFLLIIYFACLLVQISLAFNFGFLKAVGPPSQLARDTFSKRSHIRDS
jgi:hypothetical protein